MRPLVLAVGLLLAPSLSYALTSDEWAIATVALEARGESLEGQIAVGNVIRNRMKLRRLTAKGAVLQRKQFSCWNGGPSAMKSLSAEDWQRASRAWYESESASVVGRADHYFNPSIVLPSWASKMVFVRKIGNHVFYESLRG